MSASSGQQSQGQQGQGPSETTNIGTPDLQQNSNQQLQPSAPVANVAPVTSPLTSSSSNSNDSMRCLWVGCGELHQSPEQLYDHVCDKHIGRKSTNNLNLQCAWSNCNVQVVKRDHITSHIRVHVPLKPHRCNFCGKSFKRPQDLKKHVKTHADDTVINGMNQGSSRDNHQHQNGAFNMGNQPKGPSYYPEHHHMQPHPPMGYGPQTHSGAPSYYAPTQQQGYGNGYAPVSYSLGHGSGAHNASFDSAKSIAELNTFIGDIQRGLINPKSYTQLSNRLMPLQQTGVPYMLSGGMAEYQPAAAPIDLGGGHGGVYGPSAQYSLPAIDGLRTKDQLLHMAQRFEQMAATVYEAADQAAAAGTGQPGATWIDDTTDHRPYLPSPSHQLRSAHNDSPMATLSTRSNHSNGTPVLTPPSSAGGYASAHSPGSNHSNPRLSPPTPNGSMYPHLPGPAAGAGYPQSSMAPTATLSAQPEHDYRHRHGGGYLQKAQPAARHEEADAFANNAPTPKEGQRAPMAPMQARPQEVLPSNIDPALSGETPTPKAEDKGEATPKRDSRWQDTISMLQTLKAYVQRRLENNEFTVEGEQGEAQAKREEEQASLYPALPHQVEASG